MKRAEENEIDKLRNKLLGTNVSKYRGRANLTQAQMSEKLAIPRPSYTLIETGERRLLATELFALALIFRVDMEVFFDGAY